MATKLDKRDFDKVETFLKDELERRKKMDYRQRAEDQWKEVDRQVAMQEMTRMTENNEPIKPGWHNVFELGELARASEWMASDIRRILFPPTRYWFEAHTSIPDEMDIASGVEKKDDNLQDDVDNALRAFMSQQHLDFGLKDRVELSIKEAFHHGGFVAEVRWEEMQMVWGGENVKTLGAGVWVAHSMWNCWPDPSPSISGTNLFYDGSMFIETYMPRNKAKELVETSGEGWRSERWEKVKKDEHVIQSNNKEINRTKDVKIVTYWGDIYIERSDGTLSYPNHKVVLMNGTLMYMKANDTPYIPIICKFYEKQDVRHNSGMSPIVKMSPMQKMATILANKYIDNIELHVEPPIIYDGNDPQFVLNGGPVIEPGTSTATKGIPQWQAMQIGDPNAALAGITFALGHMKETLGRPGTPVGDRATKAEVVKKSQDEEVGITNFIDKMELAMRSYLYMQHEFNRTKCKEYVFYNPEMDQPDFCRIKKKDIPEQVNFEVVGARGVLGEEQRTQQATAVTAFAAGHPMFAPLLKPVELLINMYADAGVKNPEQFVKTPEEMGMPPEAQQQIQALKQALQQMGQELQQEKMKTMPKMAKIQADAASKAEGFKTDKAIEKARLTAKMIIEHQKLQAKQGQHVAAEEQTEVTHETKGDGGRKIVVKRKKSGKGHEGMVYVNGVPTKVIDINRTEDGYEGQSFPIQ